MGIRQRQIESVLKRLVSEVLQQKLADPRVRGMVSVTQVQVTADLRDASVYISVLPARYESRTMLGLSCATGRIQKMIQASISAKTMPRLEFRLDESLKKEAAVMAAIQEGINREESSP